MGRGWDNFLIDTDWPWCWWCGRGLEHRPSGWISPVWIVERAHIVNNPRREDRRAVVLLCTGCHKISHGVIPTSQVAAVMDGDRITQPSLSNLLYLKKVFDLKYYDRKFLAKNCIGGRLPRAKVVPLWQRDLVLSRRPDAPFWRTA